MIKKLMNSRIISFMLTVCLLVGMLQYDGIMVSAAVDMPDCENITKATWANDVDKVIEIIGENGEQYHYSSITIPAGCTLNIIGARVEASGVTIEAGGNICIFNNNESPGGLAVMNDDIDADEGARMTLGDRSNVLNLNREDWGIIPVYQRYYNGSKEDKEEVKLEDITGVGDDKTNYNWKCNTFVYDDSAKWVSEDLYVSDNTTVDSYLCLSDGQNLFIDGGVLNCYGLVVEEDCTLALSTVYDDDGYVVNRGQLTIDENDNIVFLGGAILQIDTSAYPRDDGEDTTNSWLSYSFVTSGGRDINPLADEYRNTVLRFRCAGDKEFVLMGDPDAITADTWKADEDKVIEIKADNSNLVKYSSIVVPKGCNLSIVGANVQVGDLDIQPGGQVTVMNNHDEQSKSIKSYGSLAVTGAFTYTGGSSMMCESNSNLIRYKSGYPYVAVPVYDMKQNDQHEDVLTDITNDPEWTWFEFIYDASEGANRWMRYEYTGDHYYWGDLGDAEYFDVDTLAIGEGEMVFIEGCEVKVNSLTVENGGMLGLVTTENRNATLTVKDSGSITFNPGAQLQIEQNSVVFEQNSWLNSYSFGRMVPDGNGGKTFESLAQTDIENQETNLRFEYISIDDSGSMAFVLMENNGDSGNQGDNGGQNQVDSEQQRLDEINSQLQRLSKEMPTWDFAVGGYEQYTTVSSENNDCLKQEIAEVLAQEFTQGRYQRLMELLGITSTDNMESQLKEYISVNSNTFSRYSFKNNHNEINPDGTQVVLSKLRCFSFTVDLSQFINDNSENDIKSALTFGGRIYMFYNKLDEEAESDVSNNSIIIRINNPIGIDSDEYYIKYCSDGDDGDYENLTATESTTIENSRSLKVVTSLPLFDDEGNSTVSVFGNRASINKDEVISGDHFDNLYVTTFYSQLRDMGGKLAVYHVDSNSSYTGVYVENTTDENSTDVYIPAYDDVNTAYPIVDLADDYKKENEHSDGVNTWVQTDYLEVPSVDRFFGYKKFKITLTNQNGIDTSNSITDVKVLYNSNRNSEGYSGYFPIYEEVSTNAISASVDKGSAIVEFKSDYYDNALIVLKDSKNKQHCFSITRTGIVISNGRSSNENGTSCYPVRHGHVDVKDSSGNSVVMKKDGSFEYGIYATYYYPDKNQSAADVDLYVTVTYQDGRKDSALLTSDIFTAAYTDSFGTKFTASSDYFIYMDTAQEGIAPAKVEAIAVPKSDSNGRIKGAKFGSGNGVTKKIVIDY